MPGLRMDRKTADIAEWRQGAAEWRQGAAETAGSWWPDWDAWLAKQSKGKKVPAREPGAVLGRIGEAPGAYVKVRFDEC